MDQDQTWIGMHIGINVIFESLFIVIVAAIAIFYANRAIHHLFLRLSPRFRLSYETVFSLERLSNLVLWGAVGLIILGLWGVSVTGLWTIFISVAAVIGVGFLAVWTMISNITASVFISIWRPFRLGAIVEILSENLRGRVIDRNMMFTVLREREGCTLYVPNNLFFQKVFRVTGDTHKHASEFYEPQNGVPSNRQAII